MLRHSPLPLTHDALKLSNELCCDLTRVLKCTQRLAGVSVVIICELHKRVHNTDITLEDLTTGTPAKSIRYAPGNRPSLVAACREVAEVIGPHFVAELTLTGIPVGYGTWDMPDVGVVFDSAPPLKYAEDVRLCGLWGFVPPPWHSAARSNADIGSQSEALMRNFAGIKALRMWLESHVFNKFNWTFLRQESSRGLRLIKVSARPLALTDDFYRAVEDLLHYCINLPLPRAEPLELDFPENFFTGQVGLRIIQVGIRNFQF